MPSPCGALCTKQNIYIKKKWCKGLHSGSQILSNLGWSSLEYRRYDSRFAMFYKIQYDLVAVSMQSYFERTI